MTDRHATNHRTVLTTKTSSESMAQELPGSDLSAQTERKKIATNDRNLS